MNPWWQMFQLPFANYDQHVNPVTTWLSPQYTVNIKGNTAIEAKVQTEVASFGAQLGALTDAVLELAGSQSGEKLDRLRQLQAAVDTVKVEHRQALAARLRVDLGVLKDEDPAAYHKLLKAVAADE